MLADALALADTEEPELIVSMATLTGAARVALGPDLPALFTRSDALSEALSAAAAEEADPLWRLPLWPPYDKLIASKIADVNHISGGPHAGAITAALFLAEFVDDTRWAHIDIAGPAYLKKENAYCGPGGSGFGVRLLIELLERV